MTVYADLAFALNAVLDYGLLLAGARLSGSAICRKRLIPAALFGGVYAAAALFPQLVFLKNGAIRAACLAAMLLIAFGAEKRLLKRALYVLAVSSGFAGFVLAAVHLFGTGLLVLPGGAYYPVSFSALLFLAAAGYLAVRLAAAGFAVRAGRKILPLTIFCRGKSAELRALLDTGNTLTDGVTGCAVIVADWSAAAKILPGDLRKEAFADAAKLVETLRSSIPEAAPRLISYRAVGVGSGLLPAVRLQTELGGRPAKRLVAFSLTPISDGSFDALTGGET